MIKNIVKFKKENDTLRDSQDTGIPIRTLISRNFLILFTDTESYVIDCTEKDLLSMPETCTIILTDSYAN